MLLTAYGVAPHRLRRRQRGANKNVAPSTERASDTYWIDQIIEEHTAIPQTTHEQEVEVALRVIRESFAEEHVMDEEEAEELRQVLAMPASSFRVEQSPR